MTKCLHNRYVLKHCALCRAGNLRPNNHNICYISEGHKCTSSVLNLIHSTWFNTSVGPITFLNILFSYLRCRLRGTTAILDCMEYFSILLFIWDHGFWFQLKFFRVFLQKNVEVLSQLLIRLCRWECSLNLNSTYAIRCKFILDDKKLHVHFAFWLSCGYVKPYNINEPCTKKAGLNTLDRYRPLSTLHRYRPLSISILMNSN